MKWRSTRRTRTVNQKKMIHFVPRDQKEWFVLVLVFATQIDSSAHKYHTKLTRTSEHLSDCVMNNFSQVTKNEPRQISVPKEEKIKGKIRKKSKCQSNCIQILYFYLLRKGRTCKLELPIDVRKEKITKNY